MQTLAVIGAGYVGLVTAACFALHYRVIVVEHDQNKLKKLLQGIVPFYEPDLETYLTKGIKSGNLSFTASLEEALSSTPTAIFICVGTPAQKDGSADLSAVNHVAHTLSTILHHACVVVTKSTVPVGTTRNLQKLFQSLPVIIQCVSNPEFLREGSSINDFLYPDRIIVGTTSIHARQVMEKIYAPFLKNNALFLCMNEESSELSKYASNAMLATRVSFINEMAQIALRVGASIDDVVKGVGSDPRIGSSYLQPGIGYGGICLPKDLRALRFIAHSHGYEDSLLKAVESINSHQPFTLISFLKEFYGESLATKHVGVWGLSFKPNTDDVRYAPAFTIISYLKTLGIEITVYDPKALETTKSHYGATVYYAQSKEEVLENADCLIIATEWPEFIKTPLSDFSKLRDKVVVDGRGCFDSNAMKLHGIHYRTLNMPTI